MRGAVQSDTFKTSGPKPVFLMVYFIKSQLQRVPTAYQLQQYQLEGQDGKYAKGNGPALVYSNIHVLCQKQKNQVESRSFLSSNYFRTCLCARASVCDRTQ